MMENKRINQETKLLKFSEFGSPQQVVELHLEHITSINKNEVLVAIEVAPIHISDIMMINGHYGIKPILPSTIGAEGIGRVIEIGSDENHAWLGKRVAILPYYEQGTWSSHIVVTTDKIVEVSETADATQLGQLSINAVTAFLSLKEYTNLMPGDWIGQTAANSAVGQYVIALAKIAGLKTLNIVRREESAEFVTKLGGDVSIVIDDKLEENIAKALDGKQLSILLDTVGGQLVGRIAHYLKSRSPIVGYSSESGQTPTIAPIDLFYRRLSYHGFWVIDWFRTTPKEDIDLVIHRLNEFVDDGKLHVDIGGTYPIENYKEAFENAVKAGRPGKFFFSFKS